MQISFAKDEAEFAPLVFNKKAIEVVSSVNLLGLNISKELKWNFQVSENSRKVSARLYFLKQLKRASVATKELITFCTTCMPPVKEYASPVFHNSLPSYLSDELEGLQRRPMRIIFPHVAYREALGLARLETLLDRRQVQTVKMFQGISNNPDHKLYGFLLEPNKL